MGLNNTMRLKGMVLLAFIVASSTAFAVPVRYEFQMNVNADQPTSEDGLILDGATVVTGDFLYDNEVDSLLGRVPAWGTFYGDYAKYDQGIVTDFNGYIGDNRFSTDSTEIILANATPEDSYQGDGYFIDGGVLTLGGYPMDGFAIGDYMLAGFSFVGVGPEYLFSSWGMPAELVVDDIVLGLNLYFLDPLGRQVEVVAWDNPSLTIAAAPVSEPGSLAMLGIALFLLGVVGHRRRIVSPVYRQGVCT